MKITAQENEAKKIWLWGDPDKKADAPDGAEAEQVKPEKPQKKVTITEKEFKKLQKERKNKEKAERKLKSKEAFRSKLPKLPKFKKVERPEPTNPYIIKKNQKAKVLRALFWGIPIFFFAKGVISSFRGTMADEAQQMISAFKVDFQDYKDQDTEILAFAQNFAKEYLTYKTKGESDYKERLKPYAAGTVINAVYDLKGNSEAAYVQAYRKEEYSADQVDVFVMVEVLYTLRVLAENQTDYIDQVDRQNTILKIPVRIDGNKYIVEDLPVFVNDDVKIADFTPEQFRTKEVSTEQRNSIQQSLTNFFKAYYEEDQNVINYYLSPEANKDNFKGLNKRFTLTGIGDLKSYSNAGRIYSLVTVNIQDVNGVIMPQKFNLELIEEDGKYYVKTMDTRNVNLKIILEEEE